MMKDMVNDGSGLQVGDILAEFFVKKIEEMEEAETNDSSDNESDSDSQFYEKRKEKKSKKKKHKHKKSKKKIKSKHDSKHKHSHKTRKRKHKDDENKEIHRHHKRHKLEEYEERLISIEDTAICDNAVLHSDVSESLAVTTGLKTCSDHASTTDESTETNFKLSERILQTSSSAVIYSSPKNDLESEHSVLNSSEKKEGEHLNFQITDFECRNNPKIESSIAVQNTSQIDDIIRNENCGISRTGKVENHCDKVNKELKSSANESCTNSVAASSDTALPVSESVSSLALTSSALSTSTTTSAVSNSSFTSRSLKLAAKSRGKIVIKDLSCCQILQQVSEKGKIDSVEEGEITSEEENDILKEESQTESSEGTPFYKLDIPKEKKPKKKREKHKRKKRKKTSKKHLKRSRSNENERHHQHEKKHLKTLERPRSSSPSEREPYDLREKIDKARLLKVAQQNVLMMIEQGTLPKGVKVDAIKQEQLLNIRTGGKSVQELTDFCRALSQKDQDDSSSDGSQDKWNEDVDTPFIHHPFKLREYQPIKLNIKNATQLPIKSPAEKVADAARLRTQFPVSSGNQHRIKELEWVPVEKDEKPAPKQATLPVAVVSSNNNSSVVSTVSNVIESIPKPAVSTIDAHNTPYAALPTAYVQPIRQSRNMRNQDYDISTIVAQRLRAVRRLQENENDISALNQLYRVQKKMQEWVQSKQLPGQYTGGTDIRMLSPEELRGPIPVWVKKDQFSRAMPVTEGIGMHLLRKMGWNPGEGLGKNKEGVLEPLLPDIKTDKRGLISNDDVSKKMLPPPMKRDLSGKHPVSVLMELCSKRKWGLPTFELIDENGPDHRKTFLFKVRINNVEYQPTCSSPNKKHAKAQAATVCLQALGLVPRDLNNPL